MTHPEYWVMRVVLPHDRDRTIAAHLASLALVHEGALALLPSGDICEPVEVFSEEMAAHQHREKLLRDSPGEQFRVVLNADMGRD